MPVRDVTVNATDLMRTCYGNDTYFYPVSGRFRAITREPFEGFDQSIEVLLTDQMVPVPVKCDPRTGCPAARVRARKNTRMHHG